MRQFTYSFGESLPGELQYVEGSHSFFYASDDSKARTEMAAGVAHLLVGYLSINVNPDTGRLIYVDGLLARQSWKSVTVGAPTFVEGNVHLREPPLQFRDVERLMNTWTTPGEIFWIPGYDTTTGWVRLGDEEQETESRVLIADGTVIGLSEGRISSIWLRSGPGL